MIDLRTAFRRVKDFAGQDIWDLELTSVSFIKRQVVRLVRILLLTLKGFREDELTLRASGLTFISLLTLAPLLAFVFTIFKGMGRGREMIEQIKGFVAEMPVQVQEFVQTILDYVESSSTVGVGGMAVLVLLYAVLKMMGNIEHSFNRVWGISHSRPFARKVTDYVSTLVLVPMLIMVSGALRGIRFSSVWMAQPEAVHLFYGKVLLLAPLFAVCIAFSVLYIFMPNTRVRISSALMAAFVAALVWMGWQKFYILSQSWLFAGESKDKVFGVFAAVPIFMLWLYVSWTIVLFGAELAFAMQNFGTYAREQKAGKASGESRVLLGIAVVAEMTRAMLGSRPTFSASAYAREHGVPIRLLNDVIGVLEGVGLVGRISEDTGEFVLLKAPDQLGVQHVVDVMLQDGARPISLGLSHLDPAANHAWETAAGAMHQALGDKSFRVLVETPAEES